MLTYKELVAENRALKEENAALRARVCELEGRIQKIEGRLGQNSRNSSRPPSADPPGAPKPPKREPSGRKRGGQPGHDGRTRGLLAPEQVDRTVELKPEKCGRCGAALRGEDPSPQRHQVTEIPKPEPQVTEYRLHALECPRCGGTTRAELPGGVARGAFGSRLQAIVGVCTGVYRLSKRTTEDLLQDLLGAKISLGSVSACEEAVSEALAEPVEEARAYVQEQAVAYVDETGWREANAKAWLWAAVTNLVTVFMIHASRGAKAARELLGEFAGTLVSDRWSAYTIWDPAVRQLCWAHLKRNFTAFLDRGKRSAEIGRGLLAEVNSMFGLWYRVRDGTLKRSIFRDYMRPARQRVEDLLRRGASCGEAKTEETCRRILKLAPALWTFVRIEGVEPTNNAAERAVRPGVLWRKGSFGTDSARASRFAERMLTVAATCRQQGRNVVDYVTRAVEACLRDENAPSLLPAPHTDSAIAA